MWDLPGPGLEPMSPALAGGFLTTVPPGKSKSGTFLSISALSRAAECVNQIEFPISLEHPLSGNPLPGREIDGEVIKDHVVSGK